MSKLLKALVVICSVMAGGLLAQDSDVLGSRFFSSRVTLNEKPLLAGAIFKDTAGHMIVKGAPLAQAIGLAYGVESYQVVDAPEWVYQSHLYDIEGVPPPEALVASSETQMLQALLADRFQLQIRRETRDVTMLVLDLDRVKQGELARAAEEARAAGRTTLPPVEDLNRGIGAERAAEILALGYIPVSTQALVRGFVRHFGEPIRDLTGTGGLYGRGLGLVPALPNPESLTSVSARLAQSGVILERRAVPLNVVVVTAIERPLLDAVDR